MVRRRAAKGSFDVRPRRRRPRPCLARQAGQSAPPSHSLEPSLVPLTAVGAILVITWVGIPILALAMMLCVAGAGARGSTARPRASERCCH